ncbi:MAG: NFACT family protein [Blastocatellia bacterium]
MDNFTLHSLSDELAAVLPGQRLGRALQIGLTDLALDFRMRDGRCLLISTDPQRLALYLTARDPRKLDGEIRTDTPFISLLKKYLGGARLVTVEKTGYDRVIRFDFDAFTDTTDEDETEPVERETVRRSLAIELTGRSANAWLLESNRVIATLRQRIDAPDTWNEPAPPAGKLDPFDLPSEKLATLLDAFGGDVTTMAHTSLLGFDAFYARELAARAALSSPADALGELLAALFETPPQPRVYSGAPLAELREEPGRANVTLTLSPIVLSQTHAPHVNEFPSINQAADACLTLLDQRRGFAAKRAALESVLRTRLKKQRSLIASLERERAGYDKGPMHQRYGELLLAGLHAAVKTERGFQVTDYYDENQALIEIPAAGKPDAREAADHYFKLARKARNGLQAIAARLPAAQAQAATLDQTIAGIPGVITTAGLAELAAFTEQFQPVKATAVTRKKETPRQTGRREKEERFSGMRRYLSSDGYEILVGRSSADNDQLTMRIARPQDLWFHTADYPGSHVVLRNPQKKPVPPRAITEAAQLAAKFSHARESAKVAVNYCERRFVTKPKGFAIGQVRLSTFKTVLVPPGEPGQRIL